MTGPHVVRILILVHSIQVRSVVMKCEHFKFKREDRAHYKTFFNIYFLFYMWVFACMYLCIPCVLSAQGGQKRACIPWSHRWDSTRVPLNLDPPETILCPLHDQLVLWTTEPSLQSQKYFLKGFHHFNLYKFFLFQSSRKIQQSIGTMTYNGFI